MYSLRSAVKFWFGKGMLKNNTNLKKLKILAIYCYIVLILSIINFIIILQLKYMLK